MPSYETNTPNAGRSIVTKAGGGFNAPFVQTKKRRKNMSGYQDERIALEWLPESVCGGRIFGIWKNFLAKSVRIALLAH